MANTSKCDLRVVSHGYATHKVNVCFESLKYHCLLALIFTSHVTVDIRVEGQWYEIAKIQR